MSTTQGRALGALELLAPRAAVTAPEASDDYLVHTSTLLQLALEDVDQLALLAPDELSELKQALQSDLAAPVPGTAEEETRLRARAVLLMQALAIAGPAIRSLSAMEDGDRYLPSTAAAITARVRRARQLYAMAINASDTGEQWRTAAALDAADRLAATIPDAITDAYLGTSGVQAEILKIDPLRSLAIQIREAQTPPTPTPSRHADDLAGFAPHVGGGTAAAFLLFRLNQLRSAWRDERVRDGISARTSRELREIVFRAQIAASVGPILVTYEQLKLWERQLDLNAHLATPHREALGRALAKIEQFRFEDGDAAQVEALSEGIREAHEYLKSDEYAAAVEDIQDRFALDAIIDRAAAIAAIGLAATLAACGASIAAAPAFAALEGVIGAGAWATTITVVGTVAIETLAATLVSTALTELVYGPPEQQAELGSALLTGFAIALLTRGVISGSSVGVKRALGEAALKTGTFRAYTTAAGLVTSHAFIELHARFETGKWMSQGKRFNALLENAIGTIAGEMAQVVMTPLSARDPATAAQLDTHLKPQLDALEQQRTAMRPAAERLASGLATGDEKVAAAKQVEDVANAEAALVGTAVKDGHVPPAAMAALLAMAQRVQLQVARMGLPTSSLTPGPPAFQPGGAGVVVVEPTARPVLEQFHAQRDIELQPSSGEPDVLVAQRPGTERLAYTPTDTLPEKLPSPAKVAETPSEVERAAVDPQTEAAARANVLEYVRNSEIRASELLAYYDRHMLSGVLELFSQGQLRGGFSKWFLKKLNSKPDAVLFGRAFGRDVLVKIYRAYNKGDNWGPETDAAFDKATDRIMSAATPEAREQVLATLRGDDKAKIRALLGDAKPRKIRPKKISKRNLGIDRSTIAWQAVHHPRAQELGPRVGVTDPEKIKILADILQVRQNAEDRKYKDWTWQKRLEVIQRVDEDRVKCGLDIGPGNSIRGSISEWLFNPQRGFPKTVFVNRAPWEWKYGRPPRGHTIPDFFVDHRTHREWFNQKSDSRVTESHAKALQAAREYHAEINEREALNIPPRDTYSIHFVRTPADPATRQAMIDILMAPGSKVKRVIFGPLPDSPAVALPDQPVVLVVPEAG